MTGGLSSCAESNESLMGEGRREKFAELWVQVKWVVQVGLRTPPPHLHPYFMFPCPPVHWIERIHLWRFCVISDT